MIRKLNWENGEQNLNYIIKGTYIKCYKSQNLPSFYFNQTISNIIFI